jgi:hypothetical protein
MDRIENEKIGSNTQTRRQQDDLISILKIRGGYIDADGCTDRRTDTDGYIDMQERALIGLLFSFSK